MPVIAQPSLIVNGLELNNWITHKVTWDKCEGLLEPASMDKGAQFGSFDGPGNVSPQDMSYAPRRIVIQGQIINRRGFLDKTVVLAELRKTFEGQPAIVRQGTLYLEVEFTNIKIVSDAKFGTAGRFTYSVEGTAIPGTFFGQYHTALGADQGLAVQDDRPDSSAVKFASNSFTYTCPGTAPTEACVSLTGTASTTYYLKGRGLRRVPMTTDATGNVSIDEMSGFIVYPGANAIRVEDSAGALAAGVTAVNLYGTRPRFLGNAPTTATTQSATTNRMSEGPMLTVARTGPKSYINTAGTISTATDGQPAIGVPNGTYSASKAGLVLEGVGTNYAINSECDADSVGAGVIPTGYSNWLSAGITRSYAVTSIGAGSFAAGLKAWYQNVTGGTVTGVAGIQGPTIACSPGEIVCVSMDCWLDGSSGAVPMLTIVFNGAGVQQDTLGTTQLNRWIRLQGGPFIAPAGTTSVTLYMGIKATVVGQTITQYITAWQLEKSPFHTSYIRNQSTVAPATRSADVCGIVYPQCELLHSHDLTQAAWIVSGMGQPTKSGTDNTVTFGSTAHYLYQPVTPASVPSTTRTAAVRLKLGTLSGSVLLRLLDQSGNVIASSTITTANLSASEYRTFYVTGAPAADDTGLRVQLIGSSGTGTVIVRSLGLVQGYHPGVEVQTGDTPLPAPTSPALDPAWQQNTLLTGYFVLPIGANVAAGTVILGYVGGLLITQLASTITLSRVTAGGTRSVTITLNAADNARHSFSASCGNNTTAGVRSMSLTLTVDSTTATIDAAALYGDEEWSDLDASILVSGGAVNATLSYVRPDWPTIPTGAIPA